MTSDNHLSSLHQRPAELLQHLLRFDTTNPPGNEAECIQFIHHLLANAGIDCTLLSRSSSRPNLIARLAGQGNAPPLLLYGHVDVVTTANQNWQHPPFSGELADGYIWGRGALDMKGGVAMMLAAVLRAKSDGVRLPGDVVLVVLSDEEAGGDDGARFLVENHADLFKGIHHAIGEFGGFTFYFGNKRFYPIMIAEKQACWITATMYGPGGHGSLPVRGGAMAKLGRLLVRLDQKRLPVHITPPARYMIKALANGIGGLQGLLLGLLAKPAFTNLLLNAMGERRRLIDPLLHNTVSATTVQASDKANVIPGKVSVQLDGRLLPGLHPDDMLAEVRRLLGDEVELTLTDYDDPRSQTADGPKPLEIDMGLFDTLAGILRELDPDGVPIPYLLSAITDGRFFSRLGIQTYGFTPMQLPPDFNFTQTIHAADERIPVEAVEFGTRAIYQLLQRFGEKSS